MMKIPAFLFVTKAIHKKKGVEFPFFESVVFQKGIFGSPTKSSATRGSQLNFVLWIPAFKTVQLKN